MNGGIWFLFGLVAGIVGAWLLRRYLFKQQVVVPTPSPEVQQILEEIHTSVGQSSNPELWIMYQELLKNHGGQK